MPIEIDLQGAAQTATEVTVVGGVAWAALRLALRFGPWIDKRIDARVTPTLKAITEAAERQTHAAERQTAAIQSIADDVSDLGMAVARVEGVLGEPASHWRHERRESD